MNNFLLCGATALLLGCGSASVAQSPAALRMQAFAQGKANNCISVALIKAAIQRYGVGHVFDTLRIGSQVRVTLRNDTVLTLTDAERLQAAGWARFKQPADVPLPAAERAKVIAYVGRAMEADDSWIPDSFKRAGHGCPAGLSAPHAHNPPAGPVS